MRIAHGIRRSRCSRRPAQAQPQNTSLDYEYFKTKVQPIFLAKRPAMRAAFRVTAAARRCGCSHSRKGARPGAKRTRARTSRRSARVAAGSTRSPASQARARANRLAATSITAAASTGIPRTIRSGRS